MNLWLGWRRVWKEFRVHSVSANEYIVPVIVFAATWLVTTPFISYLSVVQVQGQTSCSFAKFVIGMCRWSHVGHQSSPAISLVSVIGKLDMTYRVQHDLPVFNRLMDPMELNETQVADFMGRPSKGLAEGFSFPEDLLPACTRVDSSVPLMTIINSVLELFRCGGSYTLLRKLWGSFRATLGPEEPLFSLRLW